MMTVATAMRLLDIALDATAAPAVFEGLCVGDPTSEVTRVIVCYAPTVEVLQRASKTRGTMVISREHPFFLHGGIHARYTSESLLETDPVARTGPVGSDRDLYVVQGLKNDPVVTAKRKLIAEGRLSIARYGALWDTRRPTAQSEALARALSVRLTEDRSASRQRGVVGMLESPTSAIDLARTARAQLRTRSLRVVGNPELIVQRLAVLAGDTDPPESLAALLASAPDIHGIVTGAGGILDEVDGGVGYFGDLIGSGRRMAMLAVGYGPSHEPGVREMTERIAKILDGVPVEYWGVGDPSWNPLDEKQRSR
jgi:putative NIF3 family GTP cyclohydrolase 1 type 2